MESFLQGLNVAVVSLFVTFRNEIRSDCLISTENNFQYFYENLSRVTK